MHIGHALKTVFFATLMIRYGACATPSDKLSTKLEGRRPGVADNPQQISDTKTPTSTPPSVGFWATFQIVDDETGQNKFPHDDDDAVFFANDDARWAQYSYVRNGIVLTGSYHLYSEHSHAIVSKLSPTATNQFISKMKRRGQTAKIVPFSGVPREIADVQLEKLAPAGYRWEGPWPGPEFYPPYVIDNFLTVSARTTACEQPGWRMHDGEYEAGAEISDIKRLAFDVTNLSLVRRDDTKCSGPLVWPTYQGAKYDLVWEGVIYDAEKGVSQFEIPFNEVSVVEFH